MVVALYTIIIVIIIIVTIIINNISILIAGVGSRHRRRRQIHPQCVSYICVGICLRLSYPGARQKPFAASTDLLSSGPAFFLLDASRWTGTTSICKFTRGLDDPGSACPSRDCSCRVMITWAVLGNMLEICSAAWRTCLVSHLNTYIYIHIRFRNR